MNYQKVLKKLIDILVWCVVRLGYILQYIFTKKGTKVKNLCNLVPKRLIKRHIPAIAGYRDDCGIIFKSAMEANIYRFYKWKQKTEGIIKAVEYEQWVFEFPPNEYDIKWYIPDFRVVSAGGAHFVEVKGNTTEKDIQKGRLFKKNYPGINIFYITPGEYKKIRHAYSAKIPNWE